MDVTGQTGAQQNDLWSKEDAQEEGEISNVVNEIMIPPSKEFVEALANTQALGVEVVSEPIDAVNGLKQLQGLVEGQLRLDEDEGMEWDVVKETGGDQGLDLEAADDLPELTEEELAEINLDMEENAALVDKEDLLGEGEEKEQQAGDDATKQVTKKRLFKSTISTAVSTKMRSAKALASPRKRAPLKVGNRNGENMYHQESKIASNLLSAHQKP
ncbi:Uncharacterized protein Rs2_02903 [Raphanus sativus]|nr:Uncharacterized protein Rs2_02903 [Raphanus sativus]